LNLNFILVYFLIATINTLIILLLVSCVILLVIIVIIKLISLFVKTSIQHLTFHMFQAPFLVIKFNC